MRYNKLFLYMIAFLFLAFQAYAQDSASSTMGSSGDYLNPNTGQGASRTNPDAGLAGMSQWLDQPVTTPSLTKSTTTTTTTPGPDVTKSTATKTTTAPGSEATKTTATTTSTTPSPEPASTTKSTTTTTTPGFEAPFALVGILAVAFIALKARN